MYFIHYIQTYASVNRKGNELQSHILKFRDCLLKDRNALDDLKEEIHCRIEELDARYPRTQPLHFDAGNDSGRWYIHVKGKPEIPCMHHLHCKSEEPAGKRHSFLSRERQGRRERMRNTYWFAVDYNGTGHLSPVLPKGTRGCGPARKPFTSPKDSSERCFRESPGRTRRWW